MESGMEGVGGERGKVKGRMACLPTLFGPRGKGDRETILFWLSEWERRLKRNVK